MKIKDYQVMQAHSNGASVASNKRNGTGWVDCSGGAVWNWAAFDYRISETTADGMILDELVGKYTERLALENSFSLKTGATLNMGNSPDGVTVERLIEFLCEHPECIRQVKVKKATLRAYNGKEMKTLVGKVIEVGENTLLVAAYSTNGDKIHTQRGWSDALELLDKATIDGKACGVLC